jgi:uncharacterized protein (DUF983 family)
MGTIRVAAGLASFVRKQDMPIYPPLSRTVGIKDVAADVRSPPTLLVGLRRGITRKCPSCGKGPLFSGYLAVIPTCPICSNDNEQYPSDDFAPYVTIFLVLHLMIPILVLADRAWQLSVGLEMAVAIPIFLAATLVVLPFAKGAVIGFACSRGVVRNPGSATDQ